MTHNQTLAALDRLGLSDSERASIRYGNAAKLLGLSERQERRAAIRPHFRDESAID